MMQMKGRFFENDAVTVVHIPAEFQGDTWAKGRVLISVQMLWQGREDSAVSIRLLAFSSKSSP